MAQLIFNIPDEQVQDAIDGLSRYFEYRETLDDGTSNPESPAQFARRKFAATMKGYVRAGLRKLQQDALAAIPDIDIEPE